MLPQYFLWLGGTGAVSMRSASGHLTLNLCFCIWRDLRVTYCILVPPGHQLSTHYFHAHLEPVRITQKVCRDTLHRTCVFGSGGICGSRSAIKCGRLAKC
jgi:hypothetical protein